jgi:mannose-6-phosphate isomerase-like protein (cupin superfamily)
MGSVRKISQENAAHYVWGGVCDGWHLVNRSSLSVIRERVPPGASEVRHLHGSARQFFYVLSGVATLEIAGEIHALAPGEGVEVPPGTPHRLSNNGPEPLEFLVVSQPHSHGDRVEVT